VFLLLALSGFCGLGVLALGLAMQS
jgi:hypothetical protein